MAPSYEVAWASMLVLVLALAVPPVVKIYRLIENRRKPLWIVGLLLVPFLSVGIVVFGLLQGQLLRNGILDADWIMGSPLIVTLWLCLNAAVCAVSGKHTATLLVPSPPHGGWP